MFVKEYILKLQGKKDFYISWYSNYHCKPILLCKSESILYRIDTHFILPFKSGVKITCKPEISKQKICFYGTGS